MSVKAIPDGYHSVTPYLVIDGAEEAIRFYERAFGAIEVMRMTMPPQSGVEGGERIAHAEIKIGDSHVMLSDEWPDQGFLGPKSRGGPTSSLMVYVPDVDSAFARALEAGGIQERPPEDQFWGDRMGTLADPSAIAGRSPRIRRTSAKRRCSAACGKAAWAEAQKGRQDSDPAGLMLTEDEKNVRPCSSANLCPAPNR